MWSELIMFLKNIDTKLTVFENINTLYLILLILILLFYGLIFIKC